MKRLIRTILLGSVFVLANNVYCQSEDNDPCKQKLGNEKLMDSIPPKLDQYPSASANISVEDSRDPNEIIGTEGYDALRDALQLMAAKATLLYTNILFYKKNKQ